MLGLGLIGYGMYRAAAWWHQSSQEVVIGLVIVGGIILYMNSNSR